MYFNCPRLLSVSQGGMMFSIFIVCQSVFIDCQSAPLRVSVFYEMPELCGRVFPPQSVSLRACVIIVGPPHLCKRKQLPSTCIPVIPCRPIFKGNCRISSSRDPLPTRFRKQLPSTCIPVIICRPVFKGNCRLSSPILSHERPPCTPRSLSYVIFSPNLLPHARLRPRRTHLCKKYIFRQKNLS